MPHLKYKQNPKSHFQDNADFLKPTDFRFHLKLFMPEIQDTTDGQTARQNCDTHF